VLTRNYLGGPNQGRVYETFTHDKLNRLTRYGIDSPDNGGDRTVDVAYNAIGNILSKTDFGGYTYDPAQPHQVKTAGGVNYAYDTNGHLTSTTGAQTRTNTWTAFNQPLRLEHQGKSVEFLYDEDYRRIKETITDGGTQRSITMLHPDNQGGLGYEREETRVNGVLTRIENRHYVSVGGAVVAVVKTLGDDVATRGVESTDPNLNLTLYWHKDALGSIVAVSNRNGAVLERMAFDPWGRRVSDQGVVQAGLNPAHGDRGFTGHEHLDEIGLVHMNGRMYDPVLGRFLSPDPIIQSPDELQNYNRYSYVLNSPLRYTDPSGNFIELAALKIFAAFAAAAMIADGNKHWKVVGSLVLSFALGGADGLVEQGLGNIEALFEGSALEWSTFNAGGIGNSLVAGGLTGLASSGGNLEQGLISAFTAGAFTAAGGAGLGKTELIGAHMLIGCMSSAASGGKCGPGAMSAGFAKWATMSMPSPNIVVISLVGGTASVLGGGKFGNGAATAAMGYVYNYCTQSTSKCGMAWLKNGLKGGLGILTAFGGAGVCTSGVGCVLGAPSIAFGLSNFAEASDWFANGDELTDGRNPMKQALLARGVSAKSADQVMAWGEVASAGALLKAPVKILEGGKWVDVLPNAKGALNISIIDKSTYAPLSQTSGAAAEAAGAVWDAWSPLMPK
jgi:RHS repeat-associated protein